MSVVVAVTRTTCNVALGNQDLTTADLGGLTPKAAYFIVTQAVTDGVAASHAIIGMGAATATDERWACSCGAEHGQATTDTDRRATTDECVIKLLVGSSAVDGEADFVAFIANGVRVNWGNAPGAAYLLTVVLFAGTDLSAKASTFTMPAAVGNTVDVNTVGFEPDAVLTANVGDTFNDAGSTAAHMAHGVAINKTPVQQYVWAYLSVNGAAAGQVAGRISNAYGCGDGAWNGAFVWAGEFSAFDAQGFSVTTRVGASGSDVVGYLALAFGGAVGFEAGIIDSPVANGNQAIVAPGFVPQYVHVGLTQMQAVNTAYTSGLAGSYGISTFDADDEYCNSIQDEDASATTDTQSLSDNTVINLPQDDGIAGWVASFVSFDANGWTWNFTTSLGTAVKWWYLAIEEEAATTTTTTTTTTSSTTSSTTSTTTSTTSSTTSTSTSTTTLTTTTTSSTTSSTTTSSTTSTSTSTTSTTTLPPGPPGPPVFPPDIARTFTGGGLKSFNYHKRVRTPGGWMMRIGASDARVALFELDYQVEFWRSDPAGGLDWYLDFEGFVRSWEFDQDEEGRETFVARGRGYNDLLQAEVIRYAKGSAEAAKNGVCETVAKEYADENIGPSAAAARQMQGLTIEADVGGGAAWQGDRANKNLLDVLVELAEAAPADFMVVGTGPATFEFQWKADQWGTDKTRGNAASVPATVFGSIYGNATNITYRYSRLDDVNVCYVGGEGTGAARTYVERASGTETDSPWARRAVFRDDKNEPVVAALNAKGDDELAKQTPKRMFSFDARQTAATRYGRDWDLGDLVTVEHKGKDISQKTVGVYVSMSEDGTESIQPELEDT